MHGVRYVHQVSVDDYTSLGGIVPPCGFDVRIKTGSMLSGFYETVEL